MLRKLGILMSCLATLLCVVMIIPAAAQAAPIRVAASQATNCPWSVSSADGGNTVTGDRDKIAVFTKGDGTGVQWNPNTAGVQICQASGSDSDGASWGPIPSPTGGTHDAAPGATVKNFTVTARDAGTPAPTSTTTSTTKAPPPSVTPPSSSTSVPKKTGTGGGTTASSIVAKKTGTGGGATASSSTMLPEAKPPSAPAPTATLAATGSSFVELLTQIGAGLIFLGALCLIVVRLRTRYVDLLWSHPRRR